MQDFDLKDLAINVARKTSEFFEENIRLEHQQNSFAEEEWDLFFSNCLNIFIINAYLIRLNKLELTCRISLIVSLLDLQNHINDNILHYLSMDDEEFISHFEIQDNS
jgi:hypothetical protein